MYSAGAEIDRVADRFPRSHSTQRSRRRRGKPFDRPFADRQMHQRRENAKRDAEPPYDVIRAGPLVKHAAEPHADEGADLMGEEHEAEQGRHVAHAEHQRDEAGGERHRGEPEHAHGGAEDQRARRRHRRQQERRDGDRAQRNRWRRAGSASAACPPSTPAAIEPMMLNRPMKAITQPPHFASSPLSTR